MTRTKLLFLFALTALYFVFAFLRAPFGERGRGVDRQVFTLSAELQSEGKLLYTDFFEHKGPFFHSFYYAGHLLGGPYWGEWFLESALFLAVLITAYFALCGFFPPLYSFLWCSLIPAVIWPSGQPETVAAELALFCFALFAARPRSLFLYFMLDVLGILAFLCKQTCIGVWVGISAALLIGARDETSVKKRLVSFGVFNAGGLAAWGLCILYLWRAGNLDAWWNCCFRFNVFYAEQTRMLFSEGVRRFLLNMAPNLVLFLLTAVLLLWKDRTVLKRCRWIAAWLCMLLWELYFVKAGCMFDYQFIGLRLCLIIPLILVFAGFARNRKPAAAVLLTLFALVCLGRTEMKVHFNEWRYDQAMRAGAGTPTDPAVRAGGKLAEFTPIIEKIAAAPESSLLVLGNGCEIYRAAKRPNPIAPCYYWCDTLGEFLGAEQLDVFLKSIQECGSLIIVDGMLGDCRIGEPRPSDPELNPGGKYAYYGDFADKLSKFVQENFHEVETESRKFRLYFPNEWKGN